MQIISISSQLILIINLFSITASFPNFQFSYHSTQIPHPSKAYKGGQDAYFANEKLMIVADGVGGWSQYGIDPSKYSRQLCKKGAQIFLKNEVFYSQNVVQIIAEASKSNQNLGSSTMVVISLDKQHLRTCYIGDSGFMIFRFNDVLKKYETHFEFKQQQHSFNFPFQLAQKNHGGDDPYLSICQDFTVQENDIIVMGSDGLFDNVFNTEILNIINNNFNEAHDFREISDNLAKLAVERGNNHKIESPFSKRAKQHKLNFRGGKLDDTTVVISMIKKSSIKIEKKKYQKSIKKDNSGNSRNPRNISVHSNNNDKKN